MKRILVNSPNINFCKGGVAHYYRTLELNKFDNIDYFFYNIDSDLIILKLLNNIVKYFIFVFKILKYDTIHLNPSFNNNSFYRDGGYILISRILNKNIIVFFRGWNNAFEKKVLKSSFRKYFFRFTFNKANKIIVLSEIFKNKLISLGMDAQKDFFFETTVTNTLDTQNYNLSFKLNSFNLRNINFLFLSRLIKQKGLFIVLDTFKRLTNKYNHFKMNLFIAGDGPALKEAKKYALKNKINNVSFLGRLNEKDKSKILLKSHIMFFPTDHGEGLPNCILEGMLYGLPIISRKVGGIPDWVINNKNGYLLESKQPKDFERVIVKLINDTILYKEISQRNHEKALELFTKEKVLKRLINIYNE